MRWMTWPAIGLVFVLAGCGGSVSEPPVEPTDSGEPVAAAEQRIQASATIEPKSGSQLSGTAEFVFGHGQITLKLDLEGAPAGLHAAHLHEIGDCSSDDGTSAGGHWNPMHADHGQWGTDPFHLGDIGNITVGEDGRGSLMMTTDLWTIDSGEPNDILGRSIVIHADVDDFVTQPTGAAGGRIGCGVIQ